MVWAEGKGYEMHRGGYIAVLWEDGASACGLVGCEDYGLGVLDSKRLEWVGGGDG